MKPATQFSLFILLLFCYQLWAQDGTTDQNSAQQDTQQIDGELRFGVGILSDDSYRYGRYTGLVDQGAAPLFRFHINSHPQWNSNDSRFAWFGIDYIGVNRIHALGEIGISGDQKIKLDFRKTDNFLFDDTMTVFTGKNSLTLPNTWQTTGNTTQDMTNLNATLFTQKVHQQRDRWQLNYRKQLPIDHSSSAWDIRVDYRHEDKNGQRLSAGTIGTNGGNARSAQLIAPLDFETDNFAVSVGYNASQYHIGGGYEISLFRNNNSFLQWDNPFGQQAQWAPSVGYPIGRGQLAMEPDNEMQRLFLTGGFRFSTTGNVQFDLSRAVMTQDQDYFAYSINPTLVPSVPLPRNDLNGEIVATHFNARVSLSPLSKLNLSANFRFDDRENNTPRDLYLPITGDARAQVAPVDGVLNRPYSNTKKDLRLIGKYRLSSGIRLQGTYQYVSMDRDFAQVDNSIEQLITTGLRFTRLSQFSFGVDVTTADRDSDSYLGNLPLMRAHPPGTIADDEFEDHPLLRKYHLSDRKRNGVKLRADWFPANEFSLGMSASHNRDQYDIDFFGLNESNKDSVTLDLSYNLSKNGQLGGFISRDHYGNEQSSRSFTATPGQVDDPNRNWLVTNDDRFVNVGLNFDWKDLQQSWALLSKLGLSRRTDVGLELLYSRSNGDINTSTGPALTASPLPELSTQLKTVKAYFKYNLSLGTNLDFVIQHESYRSDDFALDNVNSDTIANVLSLGNTSPRYSVNWFSFNYSIEF